jgi:hypothetical protein
MAIAPNLALLNQGTIGTLDAVASETIALPWYEKSK